MSSEVIITEDTWKEVAKMPTSTRDKVVRELGKMEFTRCAEDVHYWLNPKAHWVPYAFTKDEHPLYRCKLCPEDQGHHFHKLQMHLADVHGIESENPKEIRAYFLQMDPIRPFPYYDYMIPFIDFWLKEQLFLLLKSRDMMASWLYINLYWWDTYFHYGRQNFFQSENAAKTLALVKRAFTIWKNTPKFITTQVPALFSIGQMKSGQIDISAMDSELIGIPQGNDQIRQYHPSGVYTDETAFHINAGETFAGIKPAIQAGGRYTGVSTAFPSWFQVCAEDKLDEGLIL